MLNNMTAPEQVGRILEILAVPCQDVEEFVFIRFEFLFVWGDRGRLVWLGRK